MVFWDSLYCAQFPTVLKISTVRNSLLCPTFLGTVGILRTVETFDLGTVEILSTVGIFEKIIDILLLITLVLGCTLIIDPPVSKLIVIHFQPPVFARH